MRLPIIALFVAALFPLGALAQAERQPDSLFVALLRPGPKFLRGRPATEQPGFSEHASYMRELSRGGTLLLGGPYGDDPERFVLAGALLILRAASLADARRIALADPGVARGFLELASVHRFMAGAGVLAGQLAGPGGQ